MRLRSKEISVFNMSALDLFASALGAFILITLVLFPYFPNTGDSQERVDEVKAQLAEANTELEEASAELEQTGAELEQTSAELEEVRAQLNPALEQELQALEAELEKQRRENEEIKSVEAELEKQKKLNEELEKEGLQDFIFPHLDIVIAIDLTGSMRGMIHELKYQLSEMVEILTLISPTLGVGVVGFNDRMQNPVLRVRNLAEVRSGGRALSGLQSFINSFEAGDASGNNNDSPEAVVRAIERAIDMSWRNESKKRIVVVITDAPAYDDRVSTAYFAASSFARGPGQSISGVLAADFSNGARPFLEALSRRGKGRFVVSSGSITSSILLALLEKR